MAGRQAKIVNEQGLRLLLSLCDEARYPERNRVIVLLSHKAGLRRMEIAGLKRWHVMNSAGEIGETIDLTDAICKKGSGRIVPVHPELKSALADCFRAMPAPHHWPLILSERSMNASTGRRKLPGERVRPAPLDEPYHMTAASIGYLFDRLYAKAGLIGCSSHSGRRSFGTRAARVAVKAGASLRDVQSLLGHKHLSTTQRYIDTDTDAQRALVCLL
jgi:integrase/recombinase XerD